MFGWLKDKLSSGLQGAALTKAAEELRARLEPIEKLPGAKRHMAARLTRYVFTGEEEDVVADLAALQGTQAALRFSSIYLTAPPAKTAGLSSLLRLFPDDPEVLLRLAMVYEAANQVGSGAIHFAPSGPIPAFKGSLSWLATFLVELSVAGREREPNFPVELVTQMITVSGKDSNLLIRGPFFYEDAQGKSQVSRWINLPFSYFQCLKGFTELVSNSPDTVRPAFHQKETVSRACVLRALVALRIEPDPFVEEICSLAVSGSKEVRENAYDLVAQRFSLFRPLLESRAQKGSSDERYHAVRLLARIGDDEEHSFLKQRLEAEKSEKVCEAIRTALSDPAVRPAATERLNYELPDVPEPAIRAPLDKKILEDLRLRIEELERKAAEGFARNQYAKSQGWTRTPVTPDQAERLFDALQNFVIKGDERYHFFENSSGVDQGLLTSYPIPLEFKLIHLVRWCLLLSGPPDRWSVGYRWRVPFLNYQKAHGKPIDLRELAAAFRIIGLDELLIGQQVLQSNRYVSSPFLRSDPNAIWPYFAERLNLLEEALSLKQADGANPYQHLDDLEKRQNAFDILKMFPALPPKFVPLLWDIALGSAKTLRSYAQNCLEKVPNKEERIVGALASRQQDTRLAAAQWLGELQYREAIPALRTALSREKSETVKDELIRSLETLGVRLEELLDLDKLDQEAERGLKKGIPKDLDWFPFAQVPEVRWADSEKPVSHTILQWFLVQGYKLKNAEASPILRRYCSLFHKADRAKLGKFVIEAWIAKDTKPKYSADQAAVEAQKVAQQMAAYARQYPKYYPDFDEQRIYQNSLNQFLVQPEGSQNSTKGILAVAGACCSGEVAPIVHRYIKQWFGYRAAQCKALLQVLAWIDHPSATQVILAVANRFRTKGIQEEAMRLCQLLAQRKGWTLDELSDRTIPTAGFDEDGSMTLDYGSRTFLINLSEEMSIVITNQNGKTIASLPDANQADDSEIVKQAKSALSNTRRELKSILSLQRDRLYESLCTQRTWRFDDWDNYLRKHPIVGRYCQRLVWVAYRNDRIIESFRPLSDGTLTNHQDDEVSFEPDATIRLGHDETLGDDDRKIWLRHFSDYKVEPLFQQFGKPRFNLPEEMKEATEIKEFLGYLLKAFSLRNRLTRLGYTRGAAQDAGWFFEYKKTFMGLGIEAIIEFTGNALPEENRTVALQRLYFARKVVEGGPSISEELTLGELPRVLLAECWNDMRMAAAEGSGFAEDWEKQAEF